MKKELNKTKENEIRDQYTVVLEGLRSDFKVFGENLGIVRGKVDGLDKKADRIDARLERVEGDVVLLKSDLKEVRGNVSVLGRDVGEIKTDIREIKPPVKSLNEEHPIERIIRLEKHSKLPEFVSNLAD
jgi:archaellum component FlaC